MSDVYNSFLFYIIYILYIRRRLNSFVEVLESARKNGYTYNFSNKKKVKKDLLWALSS